MILLVNPKQQTKYPQPPLGLLTLASVLEESNYLVQVLDLNVQSISDIQYPEKVELIGVTSNTPTIKQALWTTRVLKSRFPKALVVLGGPHPSLVPGIEKDSSIDKIIRGEGEYQLLGLLNSNLLPVLPAAGSGEGPTYVNLDKLPPLAFHLVDLSKYHLHPPHGRRKPNLPMVTSRGCPFHCIFCSKGVFGSVYRTQSPEKTVSDLEYYINRFGVKEVTFYDDSFTLKQDRILRLCNLILRAGLKIIWSCETRVDLVDYYVLKTMQEAGCYSISYGIESGDQSVLDTLGKGVKLDQIKQAVAWTREVGIQTTGYFVLGIPNLRLENVLDTVDFAKSLKLDYAQFSIATPYPGTALYQSYIRGGNAPITDWTKSIYSESPISSTANRRFYLRPSYIASRIARIRSLEDIKIYLEGAKSLIGR